MSDERGEMNEEQSLRDEPETRPRSRLELFKIAGAGAAAIAGAKMLAPSDASAANGDPLTLGVTTNAASAQTKVASSVTLNDPQNPDGAFRVDAPNADYGIYGTGHSYGVAGLGPGGVLGLGTVGGVFSGSVVALNLDPQSTAGAPTGESFKGDLAVDTNGILYFCTNGGTPGTWIKLSHGGSRFLNAPIRAYDSRPGKTPGGDGKLGIGSGGTGTQANPRVVQITGNVAGLPSNAVGVFGNYTVTQPDGVGNATIWPSGAFPSTSNVNYVAGADVANSFSCGLSQTGTVSVASFATTHVIIDIAGYIL